MTHGDITYQPKIRDQPHAVYVMRNNMAAELVIKQIFPLKFDEFCLKAVS